MVKVEIVILLLGSVDDKRYSEKVKVIYDKRNSEKVKVIDLGI